MRRTRPPREPHPVKLGERDARVVEGLLDGERHVALVRLLGVERVDAAEPLVDGGLLEHHVGPDLERPARPGRVQHRRARVVGRRLEPEHEQRPGRVVEPSRGREECGGGRARARGQGLRAVARGGGWGRGGSWLLRRGGERVEVGKRAERAGEGRRGRGQVRGARSGRGPVRKALKASAC